MRTVLLSLYLICIDLIAWLLIPIDKIIKFTPDQVYTFIHWTMGKGIMKVSGVNITVNGLDNITNENYLLISNHEGIFDPLIITTVLKDTHAYIAKKEITKLKPLKYWSLRLGVKYIDRKDVRSQVKMINQLVDELKNGRNVVVFPEGTRSIDDMEFKAGTFKLAQKSHKPIIPMRIKGTHNIYEKNMRINKGEVVITFFKPITYEEYKDLNIHEIKDKVEKIVQGK